MVIPGQGRQTGARRHGKDLEQAKAAVARVKSLEQNDADAPAILRLPAAYWLDLKGYDPAAEAKKLSLPILILYGERDFQVPKVDFDLWQSGLAGRKNVTARSYPALNHAFVAGTGPSNEQEYQAPGHVAPEVVDDIAKFIGPVAGGPPWRSLSRLLSRESSRLFF
jgi:uncharacterized protein